MEDFNVGEVPATLGLSLFTAGYGLGPMILSPMSDIPSLGRRGIYLWTLFAFVVFQLPVGYATNLGMFLVFRMVRISRASHRAIVSPVLPAASSEPKISCMYN